MGKIVPSKRVVTFVPANQSEEIAKTIADKIPHLFGEYDSVCWWSEPKTENGTEQYRPLDGDIKQGPSVRMEFSVPDDDAVCDAFVKDLIKAHPWDEPVILVFESGIIKTEL